MKKTTNEASISSPSPSDRVESKRNVLFVCDEWNSSKGGLSTFNREFAINLAKTSRDDFAIHCYVCQSSESDRDDARINDVNIITAKSIPGTSDRLQWLRLPPSELPHPDVVIGHGRKFGTPAYCIVQNTKCKWVQFVHVFCEDLGKYKQTETDAVEENEKKHKEEIKLCKESNCVVAVGPRLQQKYTRCLPNTKVHIITPGILDKFVSLLDYKLANLSHTPDEFSVFVFGRGSYEDLALKGYDIIANALGSLGTKFKMTFVGSPEGQHKSVMDWFLQNTNITRRQLTVRGYCNQDEVKEMFYAADLVAMPSRTEGFGLIALEAISAGVPILLTSESGIAEALKKVDGGKSVIIDSEDPKEWSQKIRTLSKNKADERLKTSINLRESYDKTFPWDTQCEKFKEIILTMMSDNCSAESVEDDSLNSLSSLEKKRKASQGTEDMTENYAGQSVSSILNETVPADSEDFDSKAEYKGNDGQELHAAAKTGCIEIIKLLLSQGFDIDSKDRNGDTPLMWTALYGQQGAFQMLLKKGADPSLKDNKGFSVLHKAAQGGNPSIINELLSLGLDIDSRSTDGVTPLMIAATCGKQNAFQFLIQKGADPSLKDNGGFSLLHFASTGGNPSIINKLLSLGLDIDSRSNDDVTPLMTAAYRDKQKAFQILIQKGADPSLKDNGGLSLLHRAATGGNPSIINELLSLGLDIDLRSNGGVTPLMAAAYCDKQNAFQILIQKGADPSLKNNGGLSLLHFAAKGGNTSIINELLSLGLDVHLKDVYGMTPLTRAIENSNSDAVKFFISKGALK